MRKQIIKSIGIFFVLLIVLDLILFIMGKINTYIFWMVIIICGIVAYKVLPWWRNR